MNLTSNESYVIDVVKSACDKAPQHPTARITGGWVRDKLLGVPSNDIDIMLDTMTGSQFAKYLGEEVKTAIVKENPERSKHLEVAICSIPLPDGSFAKVEFVNARKEVYRKDSRIPEIKPATYVEDAFRRDLTINALFYNINTGEIEDPTGQGFNDLKNKVIRAPGEPKTRYFEDPIRVFRTIRFAARYGFTIEPNTWAAICDTEVQHDVFEAKGDEGIFKLARERIGQEILKMADGNNVAEGFDLLFRSGMLQKMFNEALTDTPYDKQMSKLDLAQENPHHKFNVWEHTRAAISNIEQLYPEESPYRAVAVLSELFHDAGKLYAPIRQQKSPGHYSYHGHEDESAKIARHFLDHFKMQRKMDPVAGKEKIPELVEHVQGLAAIHMRPYDLLDAGKGALNRFLRDAEEQGLNWRDILNMAYSDVRAKSDNAADYEQDVSKLKRLEMALEEAQRRNAESNVNLARPILNGEEIMQMFGRNDPGIWIGKVQQFLKERQLEGLVDKEEAKALVLQNFKQYMDKTVTAATGSKVLFDTVWGDILSVVYESPVEAVSMAQKLFADQGKDEAVHAYDEAARIYLKAGVMASVTAKKSMVDEGMSNVAAKLLGNRIYNPELVTLASCVRAIRKRELDLEDVKKLRVAYRMDKPTVNHYMQLMANILTSDSMQMIQRLLDGEIDGA